jgi:hypothetical protein
MPGGLSLPLAFGMNTRRIGSLVRIQFGRSHRLMGSSASMVHISPCEATLGMIKGRPSISTAPYIREGFETAPSNQAFDRSLPRSQPGPGPTRSRSGCLEGAIRRILSSGCHRNARKQSERGVPANVIGGLPARDLPFRDCPILAAGLVDLNCACRSRLIDPTSPAAQCWFRPMLLKPVAFPTLRRRICLVAVELLADRSASPRPGLDAAPSALEMG